MRNKCSKDDDGTIVNQERDCDGKAKNGINLVRAIPQTHLTLKKSAGVGLWIFICHLYSKLRFDI
jgi:hypothetical protein